MCYIGPLVGAAVTSAVWKKTKSTKVWWLNLMFYGGALFGVIDHLWNGELFLISENIAKDVLLGLVIAVSILAVWGITLVKAKSSPILASYLGRK
jgi:hypothetical protein